MTPTFIALATCFAVLVAVVSRAVFRKRGPSSLRVRAMLLVVITGLSIGTSTHVENFWRAGFVPRPDLPLAYNFFWSALMFVDLIVAAILLVRPGAGLKLAIGLMAVDLCVNLVALGPTPAVLAQIFFAGFIVMTLRAYSGSARAGLAP